jgi:anaerobic ribonucleoside-triphosphate reductase activating protein
MGKLRIAGVAEGLRNCGPGKRIVIWVQGCSLACPGCFSRRLQDKDGGTLMDKTKLARLITRLAPGHDGLTLTGGEPFDQAGELSELVSYVRANSELDILAYSGYTLEEILSGTPEMRDLLRCLDILIDGRFVKEKRIHHPWVGSSNQRLLFLNPDIRRKYRHVLDGEPGPVVMHVRVSDDKIHLIGVPGEGFLKRLSEGLSRKGIKVEGLDG